MKKRTEYLVCIIILLLYAGSGYSRGLTIGAASGTTRPYRVQSAPPGLTIGNGTTLSLGSATLSLSGSFIDYGYFNAGTSTVIFNGSSGNQLFAARDTLYNLTIDKSSGNVVSDSSFAVLGNLTCTSGNLDITSGNACFLYPTGVLSEVNGAEVLGEIGMADTLNNPSSVNPGGLGAVITSSSNLGTTFILRYTGVADTAGGNSSIKRSYKITPANDTGLNATLVFNYFPDELNGLTESNLVLFKSDNDTTWTNEGGTVNTTNHTVTLSGINSFSYWTLGSSVSPLPVELSSFAANSIGENVELNWTTATEVNCYGFEIQRSEVSAQQPANAPAESWEKIGFVKGAGNSNSPKSYSFTDNLNLAKNLNFTHLKYRLKQIDNDGQFKYSKVVEVNTVPSKFALYQNYPNPFNPTTTIDYALPKRSNVVLKVYNMLGQEVASLVNKEQAAGKYSVQLSADHYALASGVYIYRLQAGKYSSVKRLVLLK